jgi:hypothetical protein
MNRHPLAIIARWTILLIALWLVASCKSAPPEPPTVAPTPTVEQPAVRDVQITVRDIETASPIAGADVRVRDRQANTDTQGIYLFNVPHGDVLAVQVESIGYQRWQGKIDATVPGTDTLALEVQLEPNSIPGQVVDHDANPLPKAQVTVEGQPISLNETGRFHVRRVKSGDILVAEHPGYVTHRAVLDENQAELRLELTPVSVTVTVRDTMTGQKVPHVSVCTPDDVCQSTDGTGNAVLSPAVRGDLIAAQHQGYQDSNISYQDQASLTVELAPRELTGTIRDAVSGEPLTNTILFVNGEAVPLENGARYHLADLTTVDTLFVKSPGHERVTIPITPETSVYQYDALDTCAEPQSIPCVDIRLPRFAVHGIYANYGLLNWDRDRMLELIDLVDRSPILNAIVVDIKGDYGYIAFQSENPLIASVDAMGDPRLPVSEFLALCQEKHIYTIARMVIFKDSPLIEARPELAVRHPNGAIFYDREGLAWADPTRKEVWEYNIAITKEAINLGFDEIQYDYLRFPSDSTSLEVVRALVYSVPSTLESRTAAIQGFVMAAKAAVDPTPAFLSADLFGYALSVTPEHDMRIGQRLMDLAPHVDYVCPMVYPSTFIPGNLGLSSPSDSPYEVVARSMAYGLSRTDTLLRPWLQGYWYERHEFAEQRRAAEEATDTGWCFWNARGNYDELFFVPPKGIDP